MQGLLQFLVLFLVVPSILLLLFYISVNIALLRSPKRDPVEEASRALALLLGFALFVLFATLNLFAGFLPPSALGGLSDAANEPAKFIVGGFLTGLIAIALIDLLLPTRALAILVTVLSSTSLTALYLYVFVAESRNLLLLSTIGLLVGALLYAVIRPNLFVRLKLSTVLRRIFAFMRRGP